MELLTPLDTLCRLILRARENEAQVPATDPDEDADNVDDLDDNESGEALSALEDELNTGVEEEIRATLDDLADRKSTRLNSSHSCASRMPYSACKKKHNHPQQTNTLYIST